MALMLQIITLQGQIHGLKNTVCIEGELVNWADFLNVRMFKDVDLARCHRESVTRMSVGRPECR